MPNGGKGVVQQRDQTGSWGNINNSAKSIAVSKNVFSFWLSHGEQPVHATYAYQVVPGKALPEFQKDDRPP
nr:polysaccharide lyase family 8 super-sandwich domain-containing protein [Paraflavitalea speifideiaquila]